MTTEYDYATGTLSFVEAHMREAIEIRKNLRDEAILLAVIIELNRLGYTVIPPEAEP